MCATCSRAVAARCRRRSEIARWLYDKHDLDNCFVRRTSGTRNRFLRSLAAQRPVLHLRVSKRSIFRLQGAPVPKVVDTISW